MSWKWTTADLLAGCDCPTCACPQPTSVRVRVKIDGQWTEIVLRSPGETGDVPPRYAGSIELGLAMGRWWPQ